VEWASRQSFSYVSRIPVLPPETIQGEVFRGNTILRHPQWIIPNNAECPVRSRVLPWFDGL
jgi:hypothetical protein